MNRKLPVNLLSDFAYFSQRHRFVRFVVQIKRAPPVRVVAHAAVESHHSAVFGRANMFDQSSLIDRVAHQSKKVGLQRFVHGKQTSRRLRAEEKQPRPRSAAESPTRQIPGSAKPPAKRESAQAPGGSRHSERKALQSARRQATQRSLPRARRFP